MPEHILGDENIKITVICDFISPIVQKLLQSEKGFFRTSSIGVGVASPIQENVKLWRL